jgi:ketosteroid isomerase-like protein
VSETNTADAASNKRIFETFSQAYRSGDFETALRHASPDLKVIEPTSLPQRGVWNGTEGLLAVSALYEGIWQVDFHKADCYAEGQYVFLVLEATWRHRETGKTAELHTVNLITVVDQKVRTIEVFHNDTAALLATMES